MNDDLATLSGELFLVGHSLGASMLLKYLSDNPAEPRMRGLFLLATPFWSGEEEWKRGLKLRDDFASRLPRDVPIFLYQSADDEQVPIAHLAIYEASLPSAKVRRLANGGHQFNDDLALVARDIHSVARALQ